ncbi:hypothetical protein PF006_g2879 [Phytophthora fragariae]|uniref:Uncharacterized protein n=1 Tax=Phytophthora fragariae TaxID=53985 RepID=A0A6A3UQM9_9STRA|nr:hypothetical protein PF006_g2879 [Phytophthora fragariae]
MQIVVVRNAFTCILGAVVTNGCYYTGNIFSLRASPQQSLPELLTATLIWTVLSYCGVMLIAHVPSLMTQRFLGRPDYRPGVWFCMKKLMKGSIRYFAGSMGAMICLTVLVLHTSLMTKFFQFKLHFYLGDLCDLTFSAGIALAVRRIYYQETCEGRSRSLTVRDSVKHNPPPSHQTKRPKAAPTRRTASFWREYLRKLPSAVLVALAGGYVHAVSSYRILDRGQVVIVLFAVSTVLLKIGLQESAKWYIIKKGVQSIRTMCVLVGVPTVLIDTQTRILMVGTQTNTLLMIGTIGMAVVEVCTRSAKALAIIWTIRRQAKAVDEKLHQLSANTMQAEVARHMKRSPSSSSSPSPSSLQLEFDLWRRQVLSYHTAEQTADIYAEYISIGCSQSIMFWFAGHPYYPALKFNTTSTLSDLGAWRLGKFGLLVFQFVVQVLVDYICVVVEMAVGIEFDHIKGLSGFLGVLFMAMAVITINISATIYLG